MKFKRSSIFTFLPRSPSSLLLDVTCLFSILYLIKRKDKYDMVAAASAELGIVFCTIVLLTGPIWAKPAWNTWWNWEPRLTSTLILWLMYIGYFILRSALGGRKEKSLFSRTGHSRLRGCPDCLLSRWKSGTATCTPGINTKMNLHPMMIKTWVLTWLALTVVYGLCAYTAVRNGTVESTFRDHSVSTDGRMIVNLWGVTKWKLSRNGGLEVLNGQKEHR